jgi:sugar transferase (PEP-CTERM system associated)
VIATARAVFFELVDSSVFRTRILVYGAGETASHIDAKLRRKADRRGFEIVGYILLPDQACEIVKSKLINSNSSLLTIVREFEVDEIVVATSDIDTQIQVDELVNCKLNGIEVVDILSFFEREAGQIRVDILEPAWLVTSEGFRQSNFQNSIKKVFDITVSFVILAIAAPFLILTAIAIWIEGKGKAPIFYSQQRVGKQGQLFRVYKFRSMREDAEEYGEAVWASKTDDRVTRVGAFIRKTRLDEFPQILNVLNGTMSFVGPRPERPQFSKELEKEIPYYDVRHMVKPGVTGWAQLLYPYGSSTGDAYQKQLCDMYYVKNHTLFLDCLILLQTVEVVLFGKGAR